MPDALRRLSHRPTVHHHGAHERVHCVRATSGDKHSCFSAGSECPMHTASTRHGSACHCRSRLALSRHHQASPLHPAVFDLGRSSGHQATCGCCMPAPHVHYCARHCPACLRACVPASGTTPLPHPPPRPGRPLASVPVPVLLQVALRHCRITPRNTMTHLPSLLGYCPFCTNPLLRMPTSA